MLMTLDDLYNFFASKDNPHTFSSSDCGEEICVGINFELSYDPEGDQEGLTRVLLKSCHTGLNRKNYFVSDDVMTSAMNSFRNRPILAYIHEVNGEKVFGNHAHHIDEDGYIVWDEVPIGVIPESSNIRFEYDDDRQKKYLVLDGYIYDEYSFAKDIIEREETCPVSVEMKPREIVYDAKQKVLIVNDFYFSGVTVLGKRENGTDVLPGMEGSNLKLAQPDGSTIVMDNQEGGTKQVNILEKLLGKYDVTIDDIHFEYEGLNDEELEEKFASEFAANDEKFVKTFELSHDDIRVQIYQKLSKVEIVDECCYWISDVFDDYFIYEGNDHIYGQKYTKADDEVVFDGDRYELHRELLNDDEFNQLKQMRENYPMLMDRLAKFESEPEKMNILCSKDYDSIREDDSFKDLMDQDVHFELTVDEVRKRADEILLQYAKSEKLNFSMDGDHPVARKPLPTVKKKTGRYGNLFSN